jgi:hypothetical protein
MVSGRQRKSYTASAGQAMRVLRVRDSRVADIVLLEDESKDRNDAGSGRADIRFHEPHRLPT